MLAMLLFTAAGGPRSTRFALQLVAGEMLDIYACADVPLVQRGGVFGCSFAAEPVADCILALAAIDGEIREEGTERNPSAARFETKWRGSAPALASMDVWDASVKKSSQVDSRTLGHIGSCQTDRRPRSKPSRQKELPREAQQTQRALRALPALISCLSLREGSNAPRSRDPSERQLLNPIPGACHTRARAAGRASAPKDNHGQDRHPHRQEGHLGQRR